MDRMLARRAFLAVMGSVVHATGTHSAPSVRQRFLDSATEFEFQRYTEPHHSCVLPRENANTFSRRGRFLVYVSDRGGAAHAWSMDLKSSEHRQLSEGAPVEPASLTLTADERNLLYVAEGKLWMTPVAGLKPRLLWGEPGLRAEAGVAAIPDGPSAVVVEQTGHGSRLRRLPLGKGAASVMAEFPVAVLDPLPRPRRASMAVRDSGGGVWLAELDGGKPRRLPTRAGLVLDASWSPDGRTLLYLLDPQTRGVANQLRELNPDTGEETFVAPTSQFVCFGMNSDGSVLVAASSGKAQPYVMLMVRSVKRELTLCEHKSREARDVRPRFTPDSQRIYFQSDREGKPAIYGMSVDRLVERTEEESSR